VRLRLKRKSPPLVLSVQRQLGLGLKKEHGFSLATLFCNLKLKGQKMTNPETLAWLHHSAAVHGSAYSQMLLNLLERVEALEADAIEQSQSSRFCNEAIVRRLETLEAAENLRQQDEDAKLAAPTPEAAPLAGAGGQPMTTTNFRALCAEMLEAFDGLPCETNYKGQSRTVVDIDEDLFARARAALAQPEPPSLKEQLLQKLEHIRDVADKYQDTQNAIDDLREALEALND